MTNPAVRVENLSKLYRIGVASQRHDTLREAIAHAFRQRGGSNDGDSVPTSDLWALRDVSFEVLPGEAVGIVGRNGAGKSTLLKILTRITEPTTGQAHLQGRVASLLEVGTGFHPELTGRENIYLNGAILGMRRAEIARKFDEIVAFAEIERFLDTPVKRYSSGMYVRLAFAVAAHLEPEILLVDEVLAVGDAAFQKRCLGKMGEVSKSGRTVLFVSHNLAAVQALCRSAILLDNGQVSASGDVNVVIDRYLTTMKRPSAGEFGPTTRRIGSGVVQYTHATIRNHENEAVSTVRMGEGFVLELGFVCHRQNIRPTFGCILHGSFGENLMCLSTRETYGEMPKASVGGTVCLNVSHLDLLPGSYQLSIGVSHGSEESDFIEAALEVDVVPNTGMGTGKLPTRSMGVLFVPCSWDFDYT